MRQEPSLERRFEPAPIEPVDVPRVCACPAALEPLYRACVAAETASHLDHAMRNTLNGVMYSAWVLKRCLDASDAPSDARMVDAVASIDRRVHAAAGMLGNAGRRGLSEAPREDIDLADALQALLASAGLFARARLVDTLPLRVVARRDELELAAFCLLENAAEAVAADGGRVEVRVRYAHHRACVEVHDDGSGLRRVHADLALTPFFTTKRGRVGLGLPVARMLAHRLGGSLALSASDLGGLCARLALPPALGS